MAVRPIRTFGDPVLRTPARPVVDFGEPLAALVRDLFDTMDEAPGVGLAAPQIGVAQRVFVFDSGQERAAVVNPTIVFRSEETQEGEEGCLSVPGIWLPVERALRARVEGFDVEGRPIALDGIEFAARIFQHEHDHLDGVLFVDRLAPERRREAMRMIRERDLGLARAEPAPPRRRGAGKAL